MSRHGLASARARASHGWIVRRDVPWPFAVHVLERVGLRGARLRCDALTRLRVTQNPRLVKRVRKCVGWKHFQMHWLS